VTRREDGNLNAPSIEERIWGDEQGAGPLANKGSKGGINLVAIARFENLDLQPDCGGGRPHVLLRSLGRVNVVRICEQANASGVWQELTQESQPLFCQLSAKKN
jgi:hypothetical protein